jgi:hypothetical protein
VIEDFQIRLEHPIAYLLDGGHMVPHPWIWVANYKLNGVEYVAGIIQECDKRDGRQFAAQVEEMLRRSASNAAVRIWEDAPIVVDVED